MAYACAQWWQGWSACARKHALGVLGLVVWGLACGGCAVARNDLVLLNPDVTHYPAKAADASILLMTGEPERSYEELGMIFVSGVARTGYRELNDQLRKQARKAGADAVISVRYGTDYVLSLIPFFASIPYEVLSAQGLAVRFTDRAKERLSQ